MEPVEGRLACGSVGVGKLAPVEDIIEAIVSLLPGARTRDWAGVRVLITAGPTREPIDPVRFLSNYSSGQMGYAIARAAMAHGAKVVLVTGPAEATPPAVTEMVRVETADQMLRAVRDRYDSCKVVIAAGGCERFQARERLSRSEEARSGTCSPGASPDNRHPRRDWTAQGRTRAGRLRAGDRRPGPARA